MVLAMSIGDTVIEQRHRPVAGSVDDAELIGRTREGDREIDVSGGIGGAFLSLPPRWQQALWYIEVDGMPFGDAAQLLGLSANSTPALVHRAREGLHNAYLESHTRACTTRDIARLNRPSVAK
jgi:DNA-directed RNA polymerase specialized sigma24 family protein